MCLNKSKFVDVKFGETCFRDAFPWRIGWTTVVWTVFKVQKRIDGVNKLGLLHGLVKLGLDCVDFGLDLVVFRSKKLDDLGPNASRPIPNRIHEKSVAVCLVSGTRLCEFHHAGQCNVLCTVQRVHNLRRTRIGIRRIRALNTKGYVGRNDIGWTVWTIRFNRGFQSSRKRIRNNRVLIRVGSSTWSQTQIPQHLVVQLELGVAQLGFTCIASTRHCWEMQTSEFNKFNKFNEFNKMIEMCVYHRVVLKDLTIYYNVCIEYPNLEVETTRVIISIPYS